MLWPLGAMVVGLSVFYLAAQFAAMRNEILRRRVRTLMLMQAQSAPGSAA
jgi:heme exporter protein C